MPWLRKAFARTRRRSGEVSVERASRSSSQRDFRYQTEPCEEGGAGHLGCPARCRRERNPGAGAGTHGPVAEPAGAQRGVVGKRIPRGDALPSTTGDGAVAGVGPGATGPVGGAECLVARRIALGQSDRIPRPPASVRRSATQSSRPGSGTWARSGWWGTAWPPPVQPPGLEVVPIVRGEIGPQEEGRGGSRGIARVLPRSPRPARPGPARSGRHAPARGPPGTRRAPPSERGVRTNWNWAAASRVATEPGQHRAVARCDPRRATARCRHGQTRRRREAQPRLNGSPGHHQLLRLE